MNEKPHKVGVPTNTIRHWCGHSAAHVRKSAKPSVRLTRCLLMLLICWVIPPHSVAASTGLEPVHVSPTSYIPMLRNDACSRRRASNNPFGVQIYGATGTSQDDFTILKNSRSEWIRNSITWPDVEPTNRDPSDYQWRSADAAVQAAVDLCANFVVTLDLTPEWATTGTYRSPIRTDLLPEYVEFVTAVVERYDGDGFEDAPSGAVVNYWEFYNEPDLGPVHADLEGWGEHGARYAEMLMAVYDPVHEANPNAKVVFGGIAYNAFIEHGGFVVREFFQKVLDAEGGDYFDVMNFHYYPFEHNRFAWTESNSSGLMEKFADINQKLQAKGLNKPIMLTEIGWHSEDDDDFPSTPEYQSRQVVQLLTQSMAFGSQATIWWTLVDTCCGFPYKTGLAVTSSPNSVKPAYTVYQELVKRLGASDFVEVISTTGINNDLEVYKFHTPETNQHFYVAWLNPVTPYTAEAAASFDDTATQNLQVPGSKATIYAKDGVLTQTINDWEDGITDGMVTFSVMRSPIYIVID
jgi:arabinogalactan endo-1,4-beta-galactosidase